MIINLKEEEKEYLVIKKNKIEIKEGCPKEIKEKLQFLLFILKEGAKYDIKK